MKAILKRSAVLATLLISLFAASLPADGNMQKIFHGDSDEYRTAYALCIAAGVLPPTSVLPTTGAEIAQALSRIPYDTLSYDEKAAYDDLMSRLVYTPIFDYPTFGLDPLPTISLDAFARTGDSKNERDMLFQREDRLEGINLSLQMKFAEAGYGFVDWVMLSPSIESYLTGQHFGTNFDVLATNPTKFQHEGVFDAGLLFGNDWMYAAVMSSGQSMGYGHTGNLALGDNFRRQQYIRLHTYSRWFDYTFNLTRYSKMADSKSEDPYALKMTSHNESFELPQQIFPQHRFEFRIADKVQIAMTEGAMMLIDSVFDPRILNPFLFVHGFNNYNDSWEDAVSDRIGDEANNILVLEVAWSIAPHHRVSLQAMSDQIQIGGETRLMPNAFGFLANYETAWILGKGYLTGWAEGAYIMPAAYLNQKLAHIDKNNKGEITDWDYTHNYDFIGGYHMWGYNDSNGDIDYTGYAYGPDSIVFGVGATYGVPGLFSVDGSLKYIIHGMYGLGYRSIVATRDGDEAGKLFSLPIADAEHRIELLVNGSYTPVKGLELIGGIGFVQAWNHLTDKGKTFTDLQLHIGVSFDPVTMFSKR